MIKRLAILLALLLLASPTFPARASAQDAPADVGLTDSELRLVEASLQTPVTVGVIASSEPACYWNESQGEYAGIIIELLRAVSQKTGLRMDYVPLDLSKGAPIAQLKAGSPSLVAGVIRTRRFIDDAQIALTDTLLADALVLAGRKQDDFTRDAAQKTIACITGFQVAWEYIAERFPEHKTAFYPTVKDCLNAVACGEADAALYTRTCLNYMLHDPHYEELEIVPAYYRDVDTCAAGLAQGGGELTSIVNKGLRALSDSERNGIVMNTTIMNPYRLSAEAVLYKYRMPLIVIAVLLLAVIAVLAALNATKRRSRNRLQAAFENEQKANEQERVALAAAERASAAKGDFMSRMSHEIRTPLNAVIGYNTIARSALTEATTDAERKRSDMRVMDCLIKSDIASRHLLTIINDVLDMSAIESGRIKLGHDRFDFKGMISALASLFYSQAKAKGVRFEVVVDAMDEEWFVGDQMRLNQILTNLLSNAVKFTPEDGMVRLAIRQTGARDGRMGVLFEVSDTGIGMAKEYLEHIWTPFEQADASISRRFGGTGLGLSITKNLVELMDGAIDVQSELGKGTTFSVRLELERTEQPKDANVFDFASVNALVADDDPSTCDYIRLLFDRCGARCQTVTSGEEAVETFAFAKRSNTPFTVCLVDWHMPRMDGIETIRRIREVAGGELPIIVITAYDFSEIADKASEVGVSTFLAKPLFQSSLFNLLANLCGKPNAAKLKKAASYDFGGARVLLAEDNDMNMEIAKRIMESAKLTVDCAWNGRDAVEMFEAAPAGTYGAILMDVRMPVMDGHEATRAIRALERLDARQIPIIAMTADAFGENVAEALASGMNAHIAKPIRLATLFGTLAQYIPNRQEAAR